MPKSDWDRGKDALEILMSYFPIDKIEALAKRAKEDARFRATLRGLLDQLNQF